MRAAKNGCLGDEGGKGGGGCNAFYLGNELVEQELGIDGTAAGFGMELGREPRLCLVPDAFVRTVVHVHEERFPVVGKRGIIDGISVILRGDEAPRGAYLLHGLVVRTVSVFQLVGLGACCACQELVAKTDAHAGTYVRVIEKRLDMLHRRFATLGVARAIGKEQTIEVERVEVIIPRHTNDLDATT